VNPTGGLYTLAGLRQISENLQAQIDAQQAKWDAIDAQAQAQQDIIDQKTQDIACYDDLINNPGQEYTLAGDNEMLERVWYSSNIKTTGQYAFANCVNATFTFAGQPQLPAVTKKIGEGAFQNTLFDVLDMSLTNTLDRNGDGTTDRRDRLGDASIGENAFLNTPVTQMLLANTSLTPGKVKEIAQSLQKADPLELEFCDWAEPAEVENLNTTLTTATLPDLGEEFDESADAGVYDFVDNATFLKCWALTSVAIPAYVTEIKDAAFLFTNVPEFDLTALEGLATVGNVAFARNPALTAVKFAKKAR
jgi:hypothetical protein